MTVLTITKTDDPATMTIELAPPIEFRGGQITTINLKEPTSRQVREAEKEITPENPWAGRTSYEMKLVGLVAGLNTAAMDALPVGAINYGASFLQDFIEAGSENNDTDDTPREDPEAVTMPIDPPLTFLGVTYTEMDLREPLASEIRKARTLMRTGTLFENRRAQMQLVTAVTGLPAPVIESLPISTLNAASRVLSRFTIAGRPTGNR